MTEQHQRVSANYKLSKLHQLFHWFCFLEVHFQSTAMSHNSDKTVMTYYKSRYYQNKPAGHTGVSPMVLFDILRSNNYDPFKLAITLAEIQ